MNKLKKTKCKYCGVKSSYTAIHKEDCYLIKKYGYITIEKIEDDKAN